MATGEAVAETQQGGGDIPIGRREEGGGGNGCQSLVGHEGVSAVCTLEWCLSGWSGWVRVDLGVVIGFRWGERVR